MKCVVLDYSKGNVDVLTIPEKDLEEFKKDTRDQDESDFVEEWLSDKYNLNEINFMYGENISINFK